MNPGKAFVAFLAGKQESKLQLAFFASTYKWLKLELTQKLIPQIHCVSHICVCARVRLIH